MYLIALITKWRNKGIRFTIGFPSRDQYELTAEMASRGKYVSVVTDDLEYACKMIDLGLTKRMEEAIDNNHSNS